MAAVMIAKARSDQLIPLSRLYKSARDYMHAKGNLEQWNHFPRLEHLRKEFEQERLFVLLDPSLQKLAGAFVLVEGSEPTYKELGLKEPYLTLHKVIGSPEFKGSGKKIFDYALSLEKPLYIDTHKDNQDMLALIETYQGKYVGTIMLEDGTRRSVYCLRS